MYGYRTKHKILTQFLKGISRDTPDGEPNYNHFVWLKEFSHKLGKTEKKAGKVAQYLATMTLEGSFEFKNDAAKQDMKVSITNKGINIALADFYAIKQNELFWKAMVNTLMTVSTVVVAIATIIALNKDNSDTRKIQERLEKIEKYQQAKEVTASPNNRHSQSCYQSIPKDSVDTAKHK